jgi:hypothetical protein
MFLFLLIQVLEYKERTRGGRLYHSTLWGRVGDPFFFSHLKRPPKLCLLASAIANQNPDLLYVTALVSSTISSRFSWSRYTQPIAPPTPNSSCLVSFLFVYLFCIIFFPLDETDTGRPSRHGRSHIKIK